jgi:hypothetical protein
MSSSDVNITSYAHVEFVVLTAVITRRFIFWNITPCSSLKISLGLLATCFMLVSFSAYSSTLKMEATCSSETPADFQLTTWHYISEDRTLQDTPSSPVHQLFVG